MENVEQLSSGVVFVHHGLGDLIMALPSLKLVADLVTDSQRIIVFVKNQTCREVLEISGLAERFDVRIVGRRTFLLDVAKLRQMRLDFLVAPQDFGGLKMRLIAALIGARQSALASQVTPCERGGFVQITDRLRWHKSRLYQQCFVAVGFPDIAKPDLQVPILDAQRRLAEQQLPPHLRSRRLMILAPGSGTAEAHKRWPAESFSQLAAQSVTCGLVEGVVVLGGADELALLERVADTAGMGGSCVAIPSKSLALTLGVLSLGACVVTNCNGLSHAGAWVGTRVVGIYGPTNPLLTGPLTPRLRIVRRRLRCSPCYRPDFIGGCRQPVCISEIAPQQVLDAVRRSLADDLGPSDVWDPNSLASEPDPRLRD
jgi:hypothetical protein